MLHRGIIWSDSYLLIAWAETGGDMRPASSRIENPAFFRASLSRCPIMHLPLAASRVVDKSKLVYYTSTTSCQF